MISESIVGDRAELRKPFSSLWDRGDWLIPGIVKRPPSNVKAKFATLKSRRACADGGRFPGWPPCMEWWRHEAAEATGSARMWIIFRTTIRQAPRRSQDG